MDGRAGRSRRGRESEDQRTSEACRGKRKGKVYPVGRQISDGASVERSNQGVAAFTGPR